MILPIFDDSTMSVIIGQLLCCRCGRSDIACHQTYRAFHAGVPWPKVWDALSIHRQECGR